MQHLRRLEVTLNENFPTATTWKTFITQFPPDLTHFTIHSMISNCREKHVTELLAPFREPFRKEKNNFRIIISQLCRSDVSLHLSNMQTLRPAFSGSTCAKISHDIRSSRYEASKSNSYFIYLAQLSIIRTISTI